jgi:hypothetical protein|tara:strand:- start:1862 stop:2104 length:243 start_codon:yes stop_codon:yes gene_type:complete
MKMLFTKANKNSYSTDSADSADINDNKVSSLVSNYSNINPRLFATPDEALIRNNVTRYNIGSIFTNLQGVKSGCGCGGKK